MPFKFTAYFCLAMAVLWPVAAFAYIDPGTGSILIQGLIAAIAAIGVALRLYWHRFIAFFRIQPAQKEKPVKSDGQEESDSN